MMTGERRWASARRGGMTVLRKVSVPKPINLPSQKLENHGLDPNVPIVPKGTVSWGSRSSASASNPWGSSTQSPKADGSSGSPSHLSGRPSSGGSGTRPSTGSSDRAHEPIANAWSSDSRPSSASGLLTSNQISAASLRPQSAETRPGSSQLSRFAEQLSENSEAWDTAGTAGKLGVTSSKNDGFALASGDFPTLGSEKDNGRKKMESQDLGSRDRPSSSSGVAPVKDRMEIPVAGEVSVNADLKNETANTWRRDNNPYAEDRVKHSVEKWQADPQGPHPYPNAGIPHQHYEAWHGPQLNNHPGGVWYRGLPGGPPFASPFPPGGFPMEPFHFYRPQIPATSLANPQPVPPPGARPRAHYPKNGDMHRPPMPDAYMHLGMPMRPGFYPGPVAYEGCYGPPMGYRNSNERDIPFMAMAAGPYSYDSYSGQSNHDAGNSYSRSDACGPNGKAWASELVEPGHSHDAQGPFRVLLKQQDDWEGKDREQKWEETITANASHVEKGDQQKPSSWENDWREDYKNDEQMDLKRNGIGEEASYQVSDQEGGSSSVPVKVKSSDNMGNAKVVDDLSVKVEHAATAYPEIPAAPKDSSLIQKIEGLNAKVCTSDGRHDLIMSVSSREEQKNTSQVVITDSDEVTTGSVHVGKKHATGTNNQAAYDESVAARDKSFKSTAASGPVISRRPMRGVHSRTDHRGKRSFSSQEVDGWRRKSPVAVFSTDLSAAHSENSNILIQGHPAREITEKSEFYHIGNDGGGSLLAMLEPSDNQAQVYDGSGASKQKRLSCNRKQNIPSEKNSSEKINATSTTEPLKGHTDLIVNAAASCEIIDNQISPICNSNLPVPNVMAESSIQPMRRNNRGGKKHRVEDASSGATLPSMVSTETDIMTNTSDDSGKTKASESELDSCSVQLSTDSKDASQSSELRLYSPSEENHVRANNQWKSQNSRRMARSAQTNKSVEKFHANEAVKWAPVRTLNKAEVSNEPSHESVVEASTVKRDNQMQNNLRNKRAEMERYISKPMAKEIAQQGSGQQQPGPRSIDKTLSNEINVKADSGPQIVEGSQPAEFASGKKGVVMESKNGDLRQNKQGKAHGSWRQHASTESNLVQGLQDAQPSNASRNVLKSVEHQRTQKPEVSSVKEQHKYSDEWSSDGWNMPENPESAVPPNVTVVKDQGVTARGKKHQLRGHKGSGNNYDHDHKKTNSGDDDKIYWQSTVPVPETSQKNLPSKEIRATGDQSTSHWQPKIQAYVTSNQWGSRPNCGPNVGAELGRSNIKDSFPQGGLPIPPQPDKETSEVVAQPHHGHSASVISKVEATSNVGHQESKRERKIASAEGCVDSLNQGSGSLVENAPLSNIDIRNEQQLPPGFRRNGNQNGRFNRHESRGDWSSSGQDNKKHNQPINRERQRHNAHYEYQPVGPCNNNRANNFGGPKNAPNSGGGKYRERGQSHSRRGGGVYHRRPSGTVRADGYD